MTEHHPDQRPVRPAWLTAVMVAAGATAAPLVILALALAFGSLAAVDEATGIGVAYGAFLATSVGLTFHRGMRPLGAGMIIGAVMLALMFLATGGVRPAA